MKLLYRLLITALIFSSISLTSCSSNKDKLEKSSEQVIYNKALEALDRKNYTNAVEYLQLLEEHYPFGPYAEHAQLELIYAYFKTREYEAVIASSDRFIRLHPQHRNVDYAYYMRGIASFHNDSALFSVLPTDVTKRDPGTARESFNYFAQLINRYPDSIYALDAQKRMIFLRNMLARYEIHVANYYFKRGAYLAAANRGRYVVENFQSTPAVPDGLAVMAQAYHLMDMKELSMDAIKVLAANYPNHPALSDKGEFDHNFSKLEKRSWVSYVTLGFFDKDQTVSYDTREIYDPYYGKNKAFSEPPAPSRQ